MARNPGLGIEYEVLLPAFFGLQLHSDKEIDDFTFGSNVSELENFDDLLVWLRLKTGEEKKFAFQLKHAARESKKVLPTSFDLNKDFLLEKYLDGFNKIKDRDDYHYILFTNRTFDHDRRGEVPNFKMTKNESCPGRRFFETSSSESSVYNFEHNQEEDEDYKNFFDRFSFYANQKNSRWLEESIIKIFKNELTATNYINFFRRWQKQEFSCNTLRKEDITVQIIDLFLTPFLLQPNYVQNEENVGANLQEAVRAFDITVVEDSDDLVKKWRLVFQESEEDMLRMAKNHKIVTKYVKKLTPELENKILCYFYHYPLILQFSEDCKDSVMTAIELCHQTRIGMKFVLLSPPVVDEMLSDFRIFRNLYDLLAVNRNVYEKIVANLQIHLPGEERMTLKELIGDDVEIMKLVTVGKVLHIMNGNFKLDTLEDLPKHYVARSVTRTLINIEVINNLKKDVVIIDCNGEYNKIVPVIEKEYIKLDDFDEHYQSLILSEGQCTEEQFDKICSSHNNVHLLKATEAQNFEWVATKGSITELKKFHLEKSIIEESGINFFNKINLICANPGLGKSTMFKYLKNNYPSGFWTVLINLKEHNSFFKEEHSIEDILNYFLNLSDRTILAKVREIFMKRRKICFFLDGLDELQQVCMERVVDCINQLSSLGFRVWASSRHNLREYLENKLNCFSINIKEFGVQEQRSYIEEQLLGYYSDAEINEIVKKIFGNVRLINHAEVFGIPLQLFMVTQMLVQDRNFYCNFDSNIFVITKLYHSFFKAKYEHYIDKIKCKHPHFLEGDLEDRLGKYKVAALQSCLDQHIFKSLNLDCADFLEKIKKEGDQLGVIVKINDGRAVFDHYSYCEYFAGIWFAENLNRVPNLEDFFFEKKYDNVRFLFDVKLAEELPAFLAVIYGDFLELAQQTEQIQYKDGGGRNILQIACCYGQKFPLLRSEYREKEYFILDREMYCIQEETLPRKSIFALLLSTKCDPLDRDEIFHWDSFAYADKTLHLFAIEEMMKKCQPNPKSFNNYKDIPTVLYYSVEQNYPNLLNLSKEIFFSGNRRESYLFGTFDNIYCQFDYRRLINLKNAQQESLLHVSARNRNHGICAMLIERGININEVDKNKQTALHLAAMRGFVEIVDLLLKKGAAITVDHKGTTPLRYAISEGYFKIVELLLEHGAKIENVNYPLQLATMKGHVDIVALLLEKGIGVNTFDEFGRSPFYWAISENHLDIAAILLNKNANIDTADKLGNNPLHWACLKGDLNMIQFLLDIGADVNVINNKGRTPLHLGVIGGHIDIVNLLLEHGANINSVDKYYERTSLHFAVYEGHFQIIKILLRRSADINITDVDNSLPLHLAVLKGYVDIVKLFLDMGSDVNAVTINGSSPLHIAADKGYSEIGKLLLKMGAKIDAVDMFKGRSPLHLAIIRGNVDMVELLLDEGANINAIDEDLWSPLHFAMHNQHFGILKLLVEKGIDVDKLKKTPSPFLAKRFDFSC